VFTSFPFFARTLRFPRSTYYPTRGMVQETLFEIKRMYDVDTNSVANVFDRGTLANLTATPTTEAHGDAVQASAGENESSHTPSSVVGAEACETDQNGNFGIETESETIKSIVVTFHYQVQTTLQLRVEELNDVALGLLDKAILDNLLTSFFANIGSTNSSCVTSSRSEQQIAKTSTISFAPSHHLTRQLRRRSNSVAGRRLNVNTSFVQLLRGVRTAPSDYVLPGVDGGE
jgi:hypothetical protein